MSQAEAAPARPRPLIVMMEALRSAEERRAAVVRDGLPSWHGEGPTVMWCMGVLAHTHHRGDMLAGWRRWCALSVPEQQAMLRAAQAMLAGLYHWPDAAPPKPARRRRGPAAG